MEQGVVLSGEGVPLSVVVSRVQEGEVLWRGVVGAVVAEGDVGHLPRSRGDAPLAILEGQSGGDPQPQGRICNNKSKLCSQLVTKLHFVTI